MTVFLIWAKPGQIITWIMVTDVAVGVACAVQHRRRGQPNYYGSTSFWLLQLLIGAAYCLNYCGHVIDDAVHHRALSLFQIGVALLTGGYAMDAWMRRRAQLRSRYGSAQ